MEINRRQFILASLQAAGAAALFPYPGKAEELPDKPKIPPENEKVLEDILPENDAEGAEEHEKENPAERSVQDDSFIDKSHSVEGYSRIPNEDEDTFGPDLMTMLRREEKLEQQLAPREIDTIIVHTTEHLQGFTGRVLNNILDEKSANYLIGGKGKVFEIVPSEHKSDGVGNSIWDGIHELNYNAINIEIFANVLAKGTYEKYSREVNTNQYSSLRRLISYLRTKHPIKHVLGHNQVAVFYAWQGGFGGERKHANYIEDGEIYIERGRKKDPGRHFRWLSVLNYNPYKIIDPDVLCGKAKMPRIHKSNYLSGQREAYVLNREGKTDFEKYHAQMSRINLLLAP